jgi:undecaprenyl-diphosphatase
VDTKLFFLINLGTANNLFDVLMPVLTKGGYILFLPYVLYMFGKGIATRNAGGKSYMRQALWTLFIAVCSLFIAEGIGTIIKNAVARIRPCHVLEGIRLLVNCPASYSMPSGHAQSYFAFAVPIFPLTREFISTMWRLFPLGLAIAVAFSRVYVGVHYPSDVVAGALIGVAVAIALVVFSGKVRQSWRWLLRH